MTVLSSHTMACTAGIFPPPGKQLLTASLDSSLVLWNPAASSHEFKSSIFYPPHAPELDPAVHGITSLAIAPSGLVACGSANGRIRLIAMPRGECVQTLDAHDKGESVEALVFMDLLGGRDGGKGVVLVSASTDGQCFVFDATTGRGRAMMRHPAAVTALTPHPAPSQHLITTACTDGSLRTWDVRNGILLAEHTGHPGAVLGVSVGKAPDGDSPLGLPEPQLVVSAGEEGASLIWRV